MSHFSCTSAANNNAALESARPNDNYEKCKCVICHEFTYRMGFAPKGEPAKRFAIGCVGVEGDNNRHSDECKFANSSATVHVSCGKIGDLLCETAPDGTVYFISECCQIIADDEKYGK